MSWERHECCICNWRPYIPGFNWAAMYLMILLCPIPVIRIFSRVPFRWIFCFHLWFLQLDLALYSVRVQWTEVELRCNLVLLFFFLILTFLCSREETKCKFRLSWAYLCNMFRVAFLYIRFSFFSSRRLVLNSWHEALNPLWDYISCMFQFLLQFPHTIISIIIKKYPTCNYYIRAF